MTRTAFCLERLPAVGGGRDDVDDRVISVDQIIVGVRADLAGLFAPIEIPPFAYDFLVQ